MTSITGRSVTEELPSPGQHPRGLGDGAESTQRADRIFRWLMTGSGLLVVAMVVLIAIFLSAEAIPALLVNNANFFTSRDWVTAQPMSFGILQLLWTTVATSLVALVVAVPVSICVALFLTQYAPTWLARPAAALVDLLAAVPSIIYGLWGAYVVAPQFVPIQDWMARWFGWIPFFRPVATVTGGTTIFLIGLVLSVMVLPIVTAITREVFAQAPRAHHEAALALGATKWETIRIAVLPFGRAGIISASMLGLGRALGETIAVLLILSALPGGTAWTWSLFNGGETFASKIAADAAELTPGLGTGAYIAAGLVLFILTFVVNAAARIVIARRAAFSE